MKPDKVVPENIDKIIEGNPEWERAEIYPGVEKSRKAGAERTGNRELLWNN